MLHVLVDEKPTAEQMAYKLARGMRFRLGFLNADARFTAAVVTADAEWVEYELEARDGSQILPRKTIMVRIAIFQASILAALTPLTEVEAQSRGYR